MKENINKFLHKDKWFFPKTICLIAFLNKPGDSFYLALSTTLYANWVKDPHIYSFDLNGGSGSFPNMNKAFGTDLKLPTAVPTKEG